MHTNNKDESLENGSNDPIGKRHSRMDYLNASHGVWDSVELSK